MNKNLTLFEEKWVFNDAICNLDDADLLLISRWNNVLIIMFSLGECT